MNSTALSGPSSRVVRALRAATLRSPSDCAPSVAIQSGPRHTQTLRGRRAAPTASDDDPQWARLRPQRAVDRNHWCPAGVDGLDALGAVDALEVDRGDAEVGVSELALD